MNSKLNLGVSALQSAYATGKRQMIARSIPLWVFPATLSLIFFGAGFIHDSRIGIKHFSGRVNKNAFPNCYITQGKILDGVLGDLPNSLLTACRKETSMVNSYLKKTNSTTPFSEDYELKYGDYENGESKNDVSRLLNDKGFIYNREESSAWREVHNNSNKFTMFYDKEGEENKKILITIDNANKKAINILYSVE